MALIPEPILIGLRAGVTLVEDGHTIRVCGPSGEYGVREPEGAVRSALLSLAGTSASEASLEETVIRSGDFAGLSRWYFHLARLKRRNALTYLVRDGAQDLLEAAPMSHGAELNVRPVHESAEYRMSRFAYSHAENGRIFVATPLSDVRLAIVDPRIAALLAAMAEARKPADLAGIAALPPAATRSCLSLLLSAKVIDEARGGLLPEEQDDTLRQWEFHDLVFHARSRLGRHDHGIGGTFRFSGKLPSLPAVRKDYPGPPIALARLASGGSGTNDPSLATVMAARRSVRRRGNAPISLDEIGVFLFRTARVERIIPADPALGRRYETSTRPYPSGGATYDLEIYLTVDQCAGLDPAVYHYDPVGHALRLVAPQGPLTDALLDGARSASKMQVRPQIVVTLTSRFQRLSWKYESIAYATTLKNVGVLYEAMYLVATAMGLAPCALGAGNSDLFSRLIGTDYYRESSVGEFMLGSR